MNKVPNNIVERIKRMNKAVYLFIHPFNLKNKLLPALFALLILCGCSEEDNVRDEFFYLRNDEADMPVYVQGNALSDVFIILLHGGPGGSSHIYNSGSMDFEERIENLYNVVYYDQRSSGISKGKFPDSKLTVDQHVEDLRQLILLIKSKYGEAISIFLMGHSWGGTLGTAYLLKNNYQWDINGWIEVSGAHNYYGMQALIGNFRQVARAQISQNNSEDFWNEVLDYIDDVDPDDATDQQISRINSYGYNAETHLLEDDVIAYEGSGLSRVEILSKMVNFYFFSGYDFVQANVNSFLTSSQLGMFDELKRLDYTPQLSQIRIPSFLIWGKYDMVVPVELGYSGYENLGTPPRHKYLLILDRAGHSVIISHSHTVVEQLKKFVTIYK